MNTFGLIMSKQKNMQVIYNDFFYRFLGPMVKMMLIYVFSCLLFIHEFHGTTDSLLQVHGT